MRKMAPLPVILDLHHRAGTDHPTALTMIHTGTNSSHSVFRGYMPVAILLSGVMGLRARAGIRSTFFHILGTVPAYQLKLIPRTGATMI